MAKDNVGSPVENITLTIDSTSGATMTAPCRLLKQGNLCLFSPTLILTRTNTNLFDPGYVVLTFDSKYAPAYDLFVAMPQFSVGDAQLNIGMLNVCPDGKVRIAACPHVNGDTYSYCSVAWFVRN